MSNKIDPLTISTAVPAGDSSPTKHKTEKDRGSRKEGIKGAAPAPAPTGDAPDNSDCNYGGMDGGDYPPSVFPFSVPANPPKRTK